MLRNLFDIKFLGPVLRSPWPWRVLRAAALAVLVVMAAAGWHHHGIPGVAVADPLMYTNLGTYLFWVVWMMGVVFVALFFGRAWCTVCPLGWLNGLAARIGLQRPLPGWLRNFVPVTLTLVALQLAVYFLAIHRFPDYTARLLGLMLLLAVLAGLVFRKRAFCSLLCPAGAVFGLYARVAPFRLRVRDAQTCAACGSRDCISGASRWRRFALGRGILYWHGRRPDCPVDLVPAELTDSADCTLCLHCAHNCEKENILLGVRPWLADLRQGLRPGETLFFLVLLGLVTANFSKVYVALREVLFWVPDRLALGLGWEAGGYYLLAALWVALFLPLLLMLPGLVVWKLSGLRTTELDAGETPSGPSDDDAPEPTSGQGVWSALGQLALPFIPLVLMAHLVLAVVKLNAKAGYLPFVVSDPPGVKSYLAMNVMQTVPAPGVLVPLDVLKWGVLALVAAGYVLSLAGARNAASGLAAKKGYLAASAVGLTLLAGLYGATVVRWLFIR